jgi:menaquinone-specific isochorismate synthase
MDANGDGVFAIALRCGQMEGRRMTLFAGGGLVAGSEEDPELAETELKLAPMLSALGHVSS